METGLACKMHWEFEKQMPDKLSSSFVMHSLRHSYITRRAEAGDTETEIMAKVGHANPNLVHTLYTHEIGRAHV